MKKAVAALRMLWVSFSLSNCVGILIFWIIYMINSDTRDSLAFFSFDDAYGMTLIATTPCLLGLVLYLAAQGRRGAYLWYIGVISSLLVLPLFLLAYVCLKLGTQCLEGETGIGTEIMLYFVSGVTVASPIVFFSKNAANSRWGFLFASAAGIAYLAMFGYLGFAL